MSFKCDECQQTTKPREKMNVKVVETREKIYHNKIKIKKDFSYVFKEWDTKGTEIVKEMHLCGACANG